MPYCIDGNFIRGIPLRRERRLAGLKTRLRNRQPGSCESIEVERLSTELIRKNMALRAPQTLQRLRFPGRTPADDSRRQEGQLVVGNRKIRSQESDDGAIEIDNNAAERALRGPVLSRKSFRFAGADPGGERAAVLYTLLGTAELNGLDPEAYLRFVLERIAEQPSNRLAELLPWNFGRQRVEHEPLAA